jgi:septal ring factor EnvC (AmiA/AmiB activator)
MIISRDTFKIFPPGLLLIAVFPAIIFCMLVAPALLPFSDTYISIAAAQEPSLQGNISTSVQAKLTPKQQQEIIDKNVRIRKLQEGIIDHKIKILGSKRQKRTLIGDLEKIEKELQTQKKLLASLRTKSEKQELLLTEKQEYLKQVLTEKRAHQVHVKNRLASYYRMGSVGLMNVLFSSESLPDLLDFNEYFGIMVQHDHAIIQKYLAQIKESNRAREEHAREQLRLMKLADDLVEKEKQLSQIRQEKNILLKQVNTEQHLYEQAVQEIEEAAADLAATLQKIQAAAKRQPVATQPQVVTEQRPGIIETEKKKLPKAPALEEGFPGQKGLLEPPVNGTVITLFSQTVKGKFESATTSNGIDIRVKKGLEIKAVYDGKIIHSGYLRGYGNLIIIDHGHQYFSMISRAADFYTEEGTKIAKGEIIGMTGDGDPLYGEGLHFEIRKGAKPEDPLLWFKEDAFPPVSSIPSN